MDMTTKNIAISAVEQSSLYLANYESVILWQTQME